MVTKTIADGSATSSPDLRKFTFDFFQFFGAAITPLDSGRKDAVLVQLPADLAEHFGRPRLSLCFHDPDEAGTFELMAHGSRIFEKMIGYLEQRSALTVQNLPSRHSSSEELLRAIHPLNTSITRLQMREETQRIFVFNWRITYRADDKREEIYAVVLDEEGARIPLRSEANVADDAGVDLEKMYADALPVPLGSNADGETVPLKLPPMTHLVRFAEIARTYASYHADLRCVGHEAEILPRLYQTLNRLTTYYGQQIEEVYDTHDRSGEKRRALERDLERKIAEEVENHRLRVRVVLFSYAILQIPVAVAGMVLSDGKHEAPVQVTLNRYSGVMRRPSCHVCKSEVQAIAVDRNGHISCDDCLRQCASCQDLLCADCGVEACSFCGQENCDACGVFCWACGGRACHTHSTACPACGDSVCLACQAECGACGSRQCRSHLRVDSVRTPDGSTTLLCAECAVRCPGCQQYSAAVGICSASGQRFCANCLQPCAKCGNLFGIGFYETMAANGKAYCQNCLEECPICHVVTPEVSACARCGARYCRLCGPVCDVCEEHCCDGCVCRYATCEHVVCSDHVAVCSAGGEEICPICHSVCGICESYTCDVHTVACRRCGCSYCANCVGASGICQTCDSIHDAGQPVELAEEPCVADPRVAALVPDYQWVQAENYRYVIYLGQNARGSSAIVVVEKDKGRPQVVMAREVGMMDSIGQRWLR